MQPAARAAGAVWNRLCQPCHRSGVRVSQRITSLPGPCGFLWNSACHRSGPDGLHPIALPRASIPEDALIIPNTAASCNAVEKIKNRQHPRIRSAAPTRSSFVRSGHRQTTQQCISYHHLPTDLGLGAMHDGIFKQRA